ncbi:MAG: FKBP-type peptidyl-prolyl cis-trans isomerase [Nitrospira sp.]|nr:FKBP-type peptidyl-prolyl cis-trans isomerase [Nitrospira sp.]
MSKLFILFMTACVALLVPNRLLHAQPSSPPIEEGSEVTLEMTISVPTEHLIIPLQASEYTHGAKQLIPGLEQALVGLHAGEKKRVELDADHAFGQYDINKKTTVSRAQLPKNITPGAITTTSEGRPFTVVSLAGDSAVIDFNHPLAGKPIVLDVVVLRVKPRT